MFLHISIRPEAFDVGAESARLLAACPGAGAAASFLGVVRSTPERPIAALALEHYPGMTERAVAGIVAEAGEKFALLGCTAVHRVGRLLPGEPIVLVLAAAAHRRAALDATGYVIDWLKTAAPFWKREEFLDGTAAWVEARAEDDVAAARW